SVTRASRVNSLASPIQGRISSIKLESCPVACSTRRMARMVATAMATTARHATMVLIWTRKGIGIRLASRDREAHRSGHLDVETQSLRELDIVALGRQDEDGSRARARGSP